MDVWPAARTSDGRLCACCACDGLSACLLVRYTAADRRMVGTQVMAM